MSAVSAEINRIIESPTKKPTESEAIKILRSCGILNKKNGVKRAYKEILIKEVSQRNGK